MYREHDELLNNYGESSGLSLCVQGTLSRLVTVLLKIRFIPVCTGNISGPLLVESANAVYPCVYREHKAIDQSCLYMCGLSLCVQGTFRQRSCG